MPRPKYRPNSPKLKSRESVYVEIPTIRQNKSGCTTCSNYRDYYLQAVQQSKEANEEIAILQKWKHEHLKETERMRDENIHLKRTVLEKDERIRKLVLENQKHERNDQQNFEKVLESITLK